MVVACAVIAMTICGFWRLGRNLTMSPVEMGRVFDKQLFEGVSSNAEVDEVVEIVGEQVRYGMQRVGENVLGWDGMRKRKLLEIAKVGQVVKPHEGTT